MSEARAEPTVRDVALAAGVSKAQAARALGGYGAVGPEVRQRVLKAADRLGYRANALARSVSGKSSRTVGMVVADIANPFFAKAVAGLTSVLRREGYSLLLADSGEDIDAEIAAVEAMLSHRVEGLVVSPASVAEAEHLQGVIRAGRPLVLFDRAVQGVSADSVSLDHRAASALMTRHFLGLGHRKIAFLSSVEHTSTRYRRGDAIATSSVADRLAGFFDAMDEAEVPHPERYVRLNAGGMDAGRRCVEDLLELSDRPTAIITSDSMIAMVAFRAIKGLDRSIPRDVALGSFDDSEWTTLTQPRVTVIAQPEFELGVEVAERLLSRLSGDASEPRTRLIEGELIVRESSGSPRT